MLPLLLIALTLAAPDNPFDLARKPKSVVTITLSDQPPSADLLAQPPMLQRTGGLLTQLNTQQIADLHNLVDPKPAAPTPEGAKPRRVCFIHITGPAGTRAIAIDQLDTGPLTATIVAPPVGAKSVSLKRPALDALLYPLGYTGSFNADDIKDPRGGAEVFELKKPYQTGPFTLDQKTNADRFGSGGGGSIRYAPAKRDLDKETLFARLPVDYDPRRPAGLLVWMDPTPAGKPWPQMFNAADATYCICIGPANAGNDREVTERLQLALDSVATARRRFSIDPARIYVTGVSGGGKMSSILLACFPDVFTGAVPIVGLSTYAAVPTGEGRKVWRADYTKPVGKRWDLLLTRRMAPVTGSEDFNHAPVAAMTAVLQADKLDVRLFDIQGMAHTFPAPDAFTTHLAWIDEPARTAADKLSASAAAAYAKPHDKTTLTEITRLYPYTPTAWQAAADLAK